MNNLSAITKKLNDQEWVVTLYKDGEERGSLIGLPSRYKAECARLKWQHLFFHKNGQNTCTLRNRCISYEGYDEGLNNYRNPQNNNLQGKEYQFWKIGYRLGKEYSMLHSFYKD